MNMFEVIASGDPVKKQANRPVRRIKPDAKLPAGSSIKTGDNSTSGKLRVAESASKVTERLPRQTSGLGKEVLAGSSQFQQKSVSSLNSCIGSPRLTSSTNDLLLHTKQAASKPSSEIVAGGIKPGHSLCIPARRRAHSNLKSSPSIESLYNVSNIVPSKPARRRAHSNLKSSPIVESLYKDSNVVPSKPPIHKLKDVKRSVATSTRTLPYAPCSVATSTRTLPYAPCSSAGRLQVPEVNSAVRSLYNMDTPDTVCRVQDTSTSEFPKSPVYNKDCRIELFRALETPKSSKPQNSVDTPVFTPKKSDSKMPRVKRLNSTPRSVGPGKFSVAAMAKNMVSTPKKSFLKMINKISTPVKTNQVLPGHTGRSPSNTLDD